jgi:hypothetical protein
MASPQKTILVEQISYAEESLRRLKVQLHQLFEDIDREYKIVLKELRTLEENETIIDEETFDRVNKILQNAWTEAMSSRKRLQDLDDDLHKLDTIMSDRLAKLRSKRNQYT